MNLLRLSSGGVRPVWKLAGFLALVATGLVLAGVVIGPLGAALPSSVLSWLWFATFAALLLAATWACLRLEGHRLADLGLGLNRARLIEASIGFGVGVVLFSAIALAQAAIVGTTWHLSPERAAGATVAGLGMMALSVVYEELLFRGYAFGQLSAAAGPTTALVVTSLAFGAYHLIGQPYWAIGAVFQFAMPTLGGLLFGYALLRSRGMALPIGLHWGGNWALAMLFGWNTGQAAPATMWTADITPDQAHALTAPDLAPHLPYLAALATIALVVWRYQAREARA